MSAPDADVVASRLRLFKRVARVTAYPLVNVQVSAGSTKVSAADRAAIVAGAEAIRAGALGAYPVIIGDASALSNQDLYNIHGARTLLDSGNAIANGAESKLSNVAPTYAARPTGQAIDITGLRIRFDIEKSVSRHPNKTTITITNLSSETRKILEKKPIAFSLEAGHDDVYRLLIAGDLHFAKSQIKGADWETLIQISEGGSAFNFARVNKTFRRGTPLVDVISHVAGQMGLALPPSVTTSDTLRAQTATGTIVLGAARDELTRLLAPYGLHWSIQRGGLQVLADDEVGDLAPILVSQETGMIGSPTYGNPTKSGKAPTLHVKMLLYPGLVPGNAIQVVSKTESGYFRIEKVKHVGDTHGEEWFSEIEARPSSPQSAAQAPLTQPKSPAFPGVNRFSQVASQGVGYFKNNKI